MEETCYHCGDDLNGSTLQQDNHSFCCNGCQMVYRILSENQLDNYYSLERQPGIKPAEKSSQKYAYLDIDTIRQKLIDFEDEHVIKATLFIPSIHCSSCIYLLENLHKIHPAVVSVQVNFTKKEASILVRKEELSFSELAELLDRIGYAPNFSAKEKTQKKLDKTLFYKLGVAGFAFGSIMLWSFPEYLGIEDVNEEFRKFSSYLSFAVSVPVLLYSASEYFISAFKALRAKSLNLDVPITIGIIALYVKSSLAIFQDEGPGYMDSFAGFIFFLLIGKWFQNKTYKALSFERDYTSYFPVAVIKIFEKSEEFVEIDTLKIGDSIRIRNEEIIPCDCEVLDGEAHIDYSFVTGESIPVTKRKGDLVYAGGKQLGSSIELKVLKASSRSHLTQLWDGSSKRNNESKSLKTQDRVSRYFIGIVLIIASFSALGWAFVAPNRIMEIITAILIVACPCALALSVPFTFGNVMRLLGRKGMYLRNVSVIENMNECTDIVFDKTGTLTTGSAGKISYQGENLSEKQIQVILNATHSSTHPLSQGVYNYLKNKHSFQKLDFKNFEEISGKGIQGKINSDTFQLGSAEFLAIPKSDETVVHFAWNKEHQGSFYFEAELREDIQNTIHQLEKTYSIHVVSGDNSKDEEVLKAIFPSSVQSIFNQSPLDKKAYIQSLQNQGRKTIMIGDGLNDSGALMEAEVGIAVSENVFRFTPASDAIIEANSLKHLPQLLNISNFGKTVLKVCLVFSLLYNTIGLSFAISGQLTPLVAAILMPISSITVVILSTVLVKFKE
jgi:P-type Cu+ transporter